MGSITPAVYGAERLGRWYRIAGIYFAAQVAGSALSGFLVSTVGLILRLGFPWSNSAATASIGVVAALAGLHDLRLLPFQLPSRSWQVPQQWKAFPPWVTAGCYGFTIGIVLVTRMPLGGLHLLVVSCIAMADPVLGVFVMAIHGAVQSLTLGAIARGQVVGNDHYNRLLCVARLAGLVAYAEGIALGFVFGFLLVGCIVGTH